MPVARDAGPDDDPSRRAAEPHAARLGFLLRLADRLRGLDDPEAIQHEAARLLGEHLGAARVGYAEILADGETSVVTRNHTAGVRSIEGRYRVADYSPALIAALRDGRTVARDDVVGSADLTPDERAAHDALEVGASVDLPLMRGGRLVGVLFMHHRTAHRWTDDELALLADVAARTWDAVERSRAESARRASEERLQRALSIDTVGVLFFTLDGRVLDANAALEQMCGYTAEELRRLAHWDRLTPPEHRAATARAAAELAEHGRTAPYEKEWVRKDGTRFWGLFAPTRVGGEGTSSECVEFVIDVGERRRTEAAERRARAEAEAARERTASLQALTAALSTASTLDGVVAAVVSHVSAAFGAAGTVVASVTPDGRELEILGAGDMPDEVRGEWRRFPLAAPAPLAEVARSGEALYLESRDDWAARYPQLLATLDATGHQANAVAPLVADGRVLGVLGAAFCEARTFGAEDRAQMTAVAQQCALALERARLFEAERAARREAEAANLAKGDFLAVMSHELRTPLNAIGGYAELLEMELRGPLTAQQRQDIGRIQASQRHLLGLINEVLNYAKLETGAVRYDVASVPVRAALSAAEALIAPQARAKGLALVVAEPAPEVAVRADAEKVRQVLVNLLSNAVKFTDRGGRIDVACAAGPERVALTVRDTGIGIAADQQERIFDPFVQVRSDLTRTAEGTGLGLAISRDLARGMGGELTVESAPDVGSVFTLALPRA
ncbi:ATP-binding protein [Roseisolibacter sp. H3M3-2]|uniref:ATP-binding protein n=1 Tax=Roseisolibacter sp. H3M3-2 TaxID=3031323 RepID=UPI0023DCA33F|nr:ATP-binding protein [Roseisolibacter sp. H3M3-2]